jgi:UDP-4-amino-4,6-dideoxy-N-acetyl-beta-L-altrosamine N-acetyltransferase
MDITKTIKIEDYLLINYTELSLDQKKTLLEIRNNVSIRKWMIDDSIISLDDHLSFIDNLENSSTNYYYAVLKSGEILGGISVTNWNSKQRTCEWGCFLNPKFFGLGLTLGYLFIRLIFNYFSAIRIYAKAMNDNIGAIQLNKAIGFKDLSVNDNIINYELRNDIWDIVPDTYKSFVKIIIQNNKSNKNKKIS